MSLINEALKKAQRAQDQAASDAPPVPGGTPVAKRRQARSANTMVLLGAGALVLVFVSVVATIYLVNRGSEPKTETAAVRPAAAPADLTTSATPAAAPAAAVPTSTPAATSAPETTAVITPTPAPEQTSPSSARPPVVDPATAPSHPTPAPALAPSTPVASASIAASPPATAAVPVVSAESPTAGPAPAAAPSRAPSAPAVSDPRIATFVDNIRVTGIRSSGGDSRVLMNDRVYRINDIVERTLGVRLIKVEADNLTFSDVNGVTYVKYF